MSVLHSCSANTGKQVDEHLLASDKNGNLLILASEYNS